MDKVRCMVALIVMVSVFGITDYRSITKGAGHEKHTNRDSGCIYIDRMDNGSARY